MRKTLVFIGCLIFLPHLFVRGGSTLPKANTLENDRYQIFLQKDKAVQIRLKNSNVSAIFKPSFYVLYRKNDPGIHITHFSALEYEMAAWKNHKNERVTDYFLAADTLFVKEASGVTTVENRIKWTFESSEGFVLNATLELPEGKELPVLKFHFQAGKAGWYSVGYAGAPTVTEQDLDAIWQPLIWQEKRFPSASYLSPEYACTLPAAFVQKKGQTWSVIADPSEIPFRFVTHKNSRFGVTVRNPRGEAQPILFAPVLGQQDSGMKKGESFSFKARLYVGTGDCYDAYRYLATQLFNFHDYRENISVSMNKTIENMIDFAMNDDYSGWNAGLKAPDYATDVKNTVKTVSALHPLSIAIVTDDGQVYKRRALPTIEYLMSREKYLFTTSKPVDTHQSPSHLLRGPATEVSELAALYEISHHNCPVFKHYAEDLFDKPRVLNLGMVSKGGSWQSALALYRMSGNTEFMEKAKKGANEYVSLRIDQPQEDFSDARIGNGLGGQFWTDFAPKWIELLELYETTGEKKYLEAATEGAKLYTNFIWLQFPITNNKIIVNEGNKVGAYAHQNRLFKNTQPMIAPEQTIPAWQVSPVGLMPEASNTFTVNRDVFLANHAAWMLRLYGYTKDTFFRDIARAAIVGRYSNYPGYCFYGEYTNIVQRADYPLRPLNEATYNTFYYNHIWPQIALTMDFLITDAIVRSENNIFFPNHYAQGYAYLQSKVYGDQPGKFYGDNDVRVWLPSGLLTTDNIQANYVAGYGNDNLYLAFLNQSGDASSLNIFIDPLVVPWEKGKTYEADVWKDNKPVPGVQMQDGRINVDISAKGITALRIKGLKIVPGFRQKLYQGKQQNHFEQGFAEKQTPFGKVTGMIISMGPSLNHAYIWLEASQDEIRQATFHFKTKGTDEWEEFTDTSYPFELSIPLNGGIPEIEYRVEVLTNHNEKLVAKPTILK